MREIDKFQSSGPKFCALSVVEGTRRPNLQTPRYFYAVASTMATSEQLELIKDSWQKVNLLQAGKTFYDRFFEIAPEAIALFKIGDEDPKTSNKIEEQARMTFQFIDDCIQNLDNIDRVIASLDELGERHVKYGAKKEHFGPVGEALLFTLEKYTKDKWTPETKAAWVALYGVIAEHMSEPLP